MQTQINLVAKVEQEKSKLVISERKQLEKQATLSGKLEVTLKENKALTTKGENDLSEMIKKDFGSNNLMEEGIFINDEFEIIAVPTIIIDNPVTLVGMGDTISSVSLVAAR